MISLGSKNPEKIKKEYTMNGWLFIVLFGVFCALVSFAISTLFFSDNNTLYFGCTDNTQEEIVYGKEVYCGEHYTTLEYKLPQEDYNKVKDIILYNGTER